MDIAQSRTLRKFADQIGGVGSVACAAHCLLLPSLLVTGTTVPAFFANELLFHWMLLGIVVPSALFAFFIGFRSHRDRHVIALVSIGLPLLVLTGFAGHDLFGHFWERVFMVGASCLLIAAHVRNYRLCHNAK